MHCWACSTSCRHSIPHLQFILQTLQPWRTYTACLQTSKAQHSMSCYRPSGPAPEALLPPRAPGPSGPPSPDRPTPPASPRSGWATLRQRTGLGSPIPPGGHPGGFASDRPSAVQTLRQASAGLQRGFGSNVSLLGLDAQGSGALQQVQCSWHIMLCYAMLCYAMLCYAVLCLENSTVRYRQA